MRGQTTMRKTARYVSPTPRWSTPSQRRDRTTTSECRLRIKRILVQTPSDGCFRRAPSLPDSPMSHSATRSVLIPRPAATARLCFALSGTLRVSAFRKSFCQRQERKNIFRTFRKRRRLALGAGHTRVASRRSAPSKNRANPNRRNRNGTLYQHRYSQRLSGQGR